MDESTNEPVVETQVPVQAAPVVKPPPTPPPSSPSAAPKPAPKPQPVKSSPPLVVELEYRLNVYSHTGNVKQSVSAPIYQDMCRRHGDIMRSISSTKWCTMDEILSNVWQLEKKMRHPANRTRKAVESALAELVECQFVIVR
jgi:hypothetical protein